MIEIHPQKNFPLLEEYKKYFNITPHTIFAYDHKIYTDDELPEHLIIHEMTHHIQQDEHGLDAWVTRYLNDPKFRLDMEIEAYTMQLRSIKDRNKRAWQLMLSAKDLSGDLYGNMITKEEAVKTLKSIMV